MWKEHFETGWHEVQMETTYSSIHIVLSGTKSWVIKYDEKNVKPDEKFSDHATRNDAFFLEATRFHNIIYAR